MGKTSGSGMNNPDHISESFWVKILKFCDAAPGWIKFGSIRDGKTSDPGSGTDVPDPHPKDRFSYETTTGS
jgi:hypothetical protein